MTIRSHPRIWFLLLGLALVLAGSVWAVYVWRNRNTTSDNFDSASPFLNTRPGVRYVGSARCAECHAKISATYAQHPMGRSVSRPDQWLPTQKKALRAFEAAGLHYAIDHKDGKILHREYATGDKGSPTAEVVAEIAYTIGSGRQGQSYIVNRAGRLYQSPISWFVRDKTWKLSPGYTIINQHFNRAILEQCVFCHANEAHADPDSINQYVPPDLHLDSIGCERCHGPGELHVAAQEHNNPDLTIVNPRRLSSQLREMICQQCHLQGEKTVARAGKSLWDYRPGLRLDAYETVFVHPPRGGNNYKAVNHVEQMHQSRCYQASKGNMDCTSCHDPHYLPPEKERVVWYRNRCLNCHEDASCRLSADERRRRADNSCIQCHMPGNDSSNIAHASITDHRIVRRPTSAPAESGTEGIDLAPFHAGADGISDSAMRRDLGVALAGYNRAPPQRSATEAWSLLRPLVQRSPEDVAALEALTLASWKRKRYREALDISDKILQQAPRRETVLVTAALSALELKQYERSLGYWKRLLEVNPYNWESQGYHGEALAKLGRWDAAIEACRASMRLDPFENEPRMLLIDCLLRKGDKQRAQAEFEMLLSLNLSKRDDLRRWFAETTKTSRP